MTTLRPLDEARREARVEGSVFVLVASGLLVVLAVTSLLSGWELLGLHGWTWLVLCVPELALLGAILYSATMDDHKDAQRALALFLSFVVVGNLTGLTLLTAALLTEKTADLSGAQLLLSGGVLWAINVIVFGLAFWALDAGGPSMRAIHGRLTPDFLFPQDGDPERARHGWYPRLEDYVYVAMTNGIAFSPTDTMPLTRSAKALMALESFISVGAVLLIAARAVNILGS